MTSVNINTDLNTDVDSTFEYLDENHHIRPEFWGTDHWSTFAYALMRVRKAQESRPTGDGTTGHLGLAQMRTNGLRHPDLKWAPNWRPEGNGKEKLYPTRIKAGIEVLWHDDWDCLRDMEAYGLLKLKSRNTVEITESGIDVARQIFQQVAIKQPPLEGNIFRAPAEVWDSFNSRDKEPRVCWSQLKVTIPR